MKENNARKYDEYSIWSFLERECRRQQKPVYFTLTSRKDIVGKQEYSFYKDNPSSKIWWGAKLNDDGIAIPGAIIFSFDKKKIYYLYRDYPHELTDEEKEIFDKENPFWVDFFKDRL